MKVLIVDDEKHVRDAIRMLVDWQHYEIRELYEAPEGAAAKLIIEQERPEIIFTDIRMPVLDGVELMQWIQQHYSDCKMIVVSGYEDFEYVRHTVKAGGSDYILKPIDPEELDEALTNAVASWKQEHEARVRQQRHTMTMNQIKPIYWDKIFSSIVQGESVYPDFAREFRQEFGSDLPDHGQVAIVCLDTIPGNLRSKFTSNVDLLFFSLANIANEYLRQTSCGYSFRYWNSMDDLVIIYWGTESTFQDRLLLINEGIRSTFKTRLDISIGTRKTFGSELSESYREARHVLRQRNLLEPIGRIHFTETSETSALPALPFAKYTSDFRAAILSSHEDQIREVTTRWILDIEQLDRVSFEQIELWKQEYTIFKSRLLADYLPDDPDPSFIRTEELSDEASTIPLDASGRLAYEMLLDEVTHDLRKLSKKVSALQQRERSVVHDIVDYIEQHYDEDLTLQHISDRFHLSREYISRRFKQELQENVSDCITRTRIDKAKLLLLNPQLRIVQIAEMVGYRDEKYFSKVFKKVIGLSPSQYRARAGDGHDR